MTEFVTIKPADNADGTPRRIPMPPGLGLPGTGALLPEAGASVPASSHFVQRVLADRDAVLVPPAEPAPAAHLTSDVMSDTVGLGPDLQTISFNEIPASRRDPGMVVEIRPN